MMWCSCSRATLHLTGSCASTCSSASAKLFHLCSTYWLPYQHAWNKLLFSLASQNGVQSVLFQNFVERTLHLLVYSTWQVKSCNAQYDNRLWRRVFYQFNSILATGNAHRAEYGQWWVATTERIEQKSDTDWTEIIKINSAKGTNIPPNLSHNNDSEHCNSEIKCTNNTHTYCITLCPYFSRSTTATRSPHPRFCEWLAVVGTVQTRNLPQLLGCMCNSKR